MGAGSLAKVPSVLNSCGVNKVMVVTGPNIVKTLGLRLKEILEKAGMQYEVFCDVEANPSVETVEEIFKMYVATGCDGFVALGGGSPMDAAKAAAARVVRPRTPLHRMAGVLKVLKPIPPFIAIPTTAGTGSETTIAAVITDRAKNHKYALMDLVLTPKYAILDPELIVSLSPRTTAATGMDALTHAVEAYVCNSYNTKESLRCAEEAVVTIMKCLEPSFRDPSDLRLRQEMLLASFKAGFAFTRAGVGNVHAIAHTLGGFYNTPHGLANAVILPIVLEDYSFAVWDKLAHLAELTGIAASGTTEERAKAFIAEIRRMNDVMGIPRGFDFILDKDIPTMIKMALAEANPVYPVPVIYDAARARRVIENIRMGA
ncbi:MAG: iron-containing alcohol dehydrogenase [Ruminococcaceae bacterium]|nr:iron-containing alcohol dehydrogenase [Oscillospiraceae bacterium]